MLKILYDRTRRFLSSKIIRVEETSTGYSLEVSAANDAYFAAVPEKVWFPTPRLHRYRRSGDNPKTWLELMIGLRVRYPPKPIGRSPAQTWIIVHSASTGQSTSSAPGASTLNPPKPDRCAEALAMATQQGDGLWETGMGFVAVESGQPVKVWTFEFADQALYPGEIREQLQRFAECGLQWRLPRLTELRKLTAALNQRGHGARVPSGGVWTDERDIMSDAQKVYLPGTTPDWGMRSDAVNLGVVAVADIGDR